MTYRDKTYCASPNCTNECGRKMLEWERKEVQREEIPVCYAYFCDVPKVELNHVLNAERNER